MQKHVVGYAEKGPETAIRISSAIKDMEKHISPLYEIMSLNPEIGVVVIRRYEDGEFCVEYSVDPKNSEMRARG